jgi:hypothetical protein
MIPALPDRPSYRWMTVTLLVATGVYVWYTFNHYGRLNDHNQRQLANATSELKATLQRAQDTVKEFDNKWIRWNKPGKKQESQPQVCDFDSTQPYLDVDGCPLDQPTWGEGMIVRPSTDPMLAIQAVGRTRADGASPPGEPIRFRFRMDRLLKELAFTDAFQLIFIATPEGTVLYQESLDQRRWLQHLRWGSQTTRDGRSGRSATVVIQNLPHVLGGKDAWDRERSTNSRTSVRLGGTSHQLYLHPLVLDSSGSKVELIMGGAIPTSTIVLDALSLDTGLLAVSVFLLLLGMLGFPFVKLAFLDRHERFRIRDVVRLYLSTGVLLVLFTCCLFAWNAYVGWRGAANRGLETLAANVEARFLEEVTAIRDQLVKYDKLVGSESIDCDDAPLQTDWFKEPKTANHTQPSFWLPPPNRKVQIRLVAWIRPDGQQIWKATSDAINARTPLKDRPYFVAVRERHLFRLPAGGRPVFFGSDRSIVNGKFYTFVSMESKIPQTFCVDSPAFQEWKKEWNKEWKPVTSATAQLLSLDRQALPAGYGFALLNPDGGTIYHSDRRLALRENFLDELSNAAVARSLMYQGRSDRFDSRYRERPHGLYLKQIPLNLVDTRTPAGFYVVTFRDTSVERAFVARAALKALLGPMILLIGIFAAGYAGLALAARALDARWSAWLWPHGGLQSIYKRQALALVGLLAAGIAASASTGSTGVFVLAPLFAAALCIGIYVHGKPERVSRSRLTGRAWHATALVLLLLCLVVIPSAALFRLVLGHEFAKAISTERAWIEAQQLEAVRAGEIEAIDESYSPSKSAGRAYNRSSYFSCVPEPYDAEVAAGAPDLPCPIPGTAIMSCGRPEAGSSAEPEGFLTQVRPGRRLYNPIDAFIVRALQWGQTELPIRSATVARQRFRDDGLTYVQAGTLLWPSSPSIAALAGFCVIIGLLIWWLRWNTNHLFFANDDANGPGASPESFKTLWRARTPDEQMLLLQIAKERIANPYQGDVVRRLLGDGLLRLAPDLQPSSEAFDEFLLSKERECEAKMVEWENVNASHSWRYVRLVLVTGVSGLGLFLFVTQPAFQSSVIGVTTALTGTVTTGLKLRDAVMSWFVTPKGLGVR